MGNLHITSQNRYVTMTTADMTRMYLLPCVLSKRVDTLNDKLKMYIVINILACIIMYYTFLGD